jgi:hypothetical protein
VLFHNAVYALVLEIRCKDVSVRIRKIPCGDCERNKIVCFTNVCCHQILENASSRESGSSSSPDENISGFSLEGEWHAGHGGCALRVHVFDVWPERGTSEGIRSGFARMPTRNQP